MRQPVTEQLLQLLPALPVGQRAEVDAITSEQVEDDVGRRPRDRQLAGPGVGGVDALLQRCEVQPALVPHHELAVDDDLPVQLAHGAGDLREVPGKRPLLSRLQNRALWTSEGDAAEPVPLRFEGPPTGMDERQRLGSLSADRAVAGTQLRR